MSKPRPIGEVLKEIRDGVREEEWTELPPDLSTIVNDPVGAVMEARRERDELAARLRAVTEALKMLDTAVSNCMTIGELYPRSDMQREVRAALARVEGPRE